MTPHVLDGAFERVARAEKHIADLRAELSRWIVEQENSVVPKFDPQPPHNLIFDTSATIGPPLIVGVLIGEASYNLRSALDYLVFELAKCDSDGEQSGTQFPIEDTKESFVHRTTRRGLLKGINLSHVAMIERLQPYKGCQWTRILRDMSNPDKHREFVRIKGNWRLDFAMSLNESDPGFAAIQRPIRRAYHPARRAEMQVKFSLTSTVTLDDGTPITDTLEQIQAQVANTLIALKPEF
jgi:hypothetical protein